MEKQDKNRKVFWSVQVPRPLNDRLDKYIDIDAFVSKSEFIRVAVRDRLKVEMKGHEAEAETQREAERASSP